MTPRQRGQRLRRVDEALRQVVSDALIIHPDPLLTRVVVTSVRTSADTAHADVFVQLSMNEQRQRRVLAALERVRPGLQATINTEMRLRNTPVLRFRLDDTAQRSERIEQLLAAHPPVADDDEAAP